ncbi:MAG: hypothetical protein KH431_06125 [Erysipelotrichaceae bacterium]|uniref:Uncharacterized protein n=1 Tax=Copranaerobaculum intestinale TaxID=2692629 RepID=A0A6N8UC33_9FIRM|nr:DUF6709 family protein [Copranaerobaculum intestinale]MBS6374164.1 hypothetical protein [Erysipelotrichaceae bacterium]MXQ74079.1 hypothetical protein [Copranaerobaculum intestinale]
MGRLMKHYRHRLQLCVLWYLLAALFICIPSFLFINHKGKGYLNAEPLSQADAEIRTLAGGDFQAWGISSWIRSNSMRNRTFIVDQNDILGPIDAAGTTYLVRLDDSFFVTVTGDYEQLYRGKGRLIPISSKLREVSFQYLKNAGYVQSGRHMTTVISPYLMEIGYAGDISVSTLYLILGLIALAVLMLIGIGYRIYRYSSLRISMVLYEESSRREKEIMDYEITDDRQVPGALAGRNCLYVQRGKFHRVIIPIKYEQIIWYYQKPLSSKKTRLVLYDSNRRCYQIKLMNKMVDEVMLSLAEKAPYAICGYQREIARKVRRNFYDLMKQVNQNRQETMMRKQFEKKKEN